MTSNDPRNTNPSRRPGKRRLLWLLVAIPIGLVASLGVVRAQAMGFGCGGGSPEQRKAFIERRLDRALSQVKANDSQRTAIKSIFERAFAELGPVHQQHQRLHDDLAAAFTANPVDRAAVEKLRGQLGGLVDRGSQVLTRAMLDAADVLSPEQRQTLVQHLRELHGRRHRHGGDL